MGANLEPLEHLPYKNVLLRLVRKQQADDSLVSGILEHSRCKMIQFRV